MADYLITLPDGSQITIQSGTIDNTYDIPLVGQDAINYGDDFATAFMRLLVNFASDTPPSFGTQKLEGQLWYDTNEGLSPVGRLKVYNGADWDIISMQEGTVTRTGTQEISGAKEFSTAPSFTAAGTPFTVNDTTQVDNLNAQYLNGNDTAYFATANQGLKADNAEPSLGNPGTNGYVLSSDTGGNRSWISPAVGTGNVNPIDIAGAGTANTMSIVLTDDPTGDQQPFTSATLTFDGTGFGTLATGIFDGDLAGNADTATTAITATTATGATNIDIDAITSTDTTTYPVLVGAASTGNQLPFIDNGDLSYNASSGTLTANAFIGSGAGLTSLNVGSGNVTGTLPTANGGTGSTLPATGTGAVVLNTSPTFSGGITTPGVNFAAGLSLNFNGVSHFLLQDYTNTNTSTGARVIADNGTFYDVGLNQMPTFNVNVSDTLEVGHVGTCQLRTTTTNRTLTLESSGATDFPIGSVTQIVNGGTSGTYTITEGAGTTLYYLEAGTGRVDTAGGCTIGNGGVATIWRQAAATYYIWGSEITP